jgi:N-terminal region of glycosyl transferase group 7
MYMKNNTPKVIFIVPYRDRETQKINFINKMKHLLDDIDRRTYDILFIHQCDNRDFNRGALKNIGFLSIKNDYPDSYKNITLCFNDIDVLIFCYRFQII